MTSEATVTKETAATETAKHTGKGMGQMKKGDDLCRIIRLRDGLYLVTLENVEGGIEALHSNPICERAARTMKAELDSEPSPTDAWDEIASCYELRARIVEALLHSHPPELAASVAEALSYSQPWKQAHRPKERDGEIPF